jgi:hypothetical protein
LLHRKSANLQDDFTTACFDTNKRNGQPQKRSNNVYYGISVKTPVLLKVICRGVESGLPLVNFAASAVIR